MYDISHIPGGTKIAKSSNICKHKGDAEKQADKGANLRLTKLRNRNKRLYHAESLLSVADYRLQKFEPQLPKSRIIVYRSSKRDYQKFECKYL